ncbi:MAG: RNA polymerase sigma factor [Acidimicrobiia bacterium]|nr:RNA polymerase sigma factor [Acidimicrobiia bacterium]
MRVARSLSGNTADAEDLVQETLLRAYRSIERFDGRYPRAWLLTIMRNANINRARRRRPQLQRDPDTAPEEVADDGRSAEDDVVDPVLDAALDDALAALPLVYRRAVELVDMAGLSYREAAEALGVRQGTVMSRLHRGRQRLRERLAATGLEGDRT